MIIYITIVYRLTVVITVVAIITDTFVFNCFTVISRGRSERDRVRERAKRAIVGKQRSARKYALRRLSFIVAVVRWCRARARAVIKE